MIPSTCLTIRSESPAISTLTGIVAESSSWRVVDKHVSKAAYSQVLFVAMLSLPPNTNNERTLLLRVKAKEPEPLFESLSGLAPSKVNAR